MFIIMNVMLYVRKMFLTEKKEIEVSYWRLLLIY